MLSYFLTFLHFLPSPPLFFPSFLLSDFLISPSPLSLFPFPLFPSQRFSPFPLQPSPFIFPLLSPFFHFPLPSSDRDSEIPPAPVPPLPHPTLGCSPLPPFHCTNPHLMAPGRFPPPDTAVLPAGSEVSQESLLLHGPFARKPKRIRTAFSPSQLLRLERAFEKNHYVVGAERKQLASSLSLSETQVWHSHPYPPVHGIELWAPHRDGDTLGEMLSGSPGVVHGILCVGLGWGCRVPALSCRSRCAALFLLCLM